MADKKLELMVNKELDLRRRYMAALPFCPDHRDKMKGLPCRQCEIERLQRENARLRFMIENGLGEEDLVRDSPTNPPT